MTWANSDSNTQDASPHRDGPDVPSYQDVSLGGVWFLARFHRHEQPTQEKVLVAGLALFILTLGYLRYDYLVTTSSARYPLVGAAILTVITAAALGAGYFAWRRRESLDIFKARWRAERTGRQAKRADKQVVKTRKERDGLVQAYLAGVRPFLQDKAVETDTGLEEMEKEIRRFLTTPPLGASRPT